MTDRDFKLLVRAFFIELCITENAKGEDLKRNSAERMEYHKKRILSELERFTKEEIEELPFKD